MIKYAIYQQNLINDHQLATGKKLYYKILFIAYSYSEIVNMTFNLRC